jgi:hypothetical protein
MQYLMVVTLVVVPRQWSLRTAVRAGFVVNAVLIAALLIHASAHVPAGSLASRLVFGVYLGVATAHFVVDASIWKLRDPATRAVLTERLPGLLSKQPPPMVAPAYVDDRYSGRR